MNNVELVNDFSNIQSIENVTIEKIEKLESVLLQMEQADIVTDHTFLDQVYERKITVPKWTILTGAPHKTDYKVRLEKGTIAVNIGNKIETLKAPMEFNAKAGEKRVGRVFDEEVVWVDIYDN
jgi:archaellum component FlaF (FlaF/FlaG flagellin family)